MLNREDVTDPEFTFYACTLGHKFTEKLDTPTCGFCVHIHLPHAYLSSYDPLLNNHHVSCVNYSENCQYDLIVCQNHNCIPDM